MAGAGAEIRIGRRAQVGRENLLIGGEGIVESPRDSGRPGDRQHLSIGPTCELARVRHAGEKLFQYLPLLNQAVGQVRVERVVDCVLHLGEVV